MGEWENGRMGERENGRMGDLGVKNKRSRCKKMKIEIFKIRKQQKRYEVPF
jgi:hypothetical protein